MVGGKEVECSGSWERRSHKGRVDVRWSKDVVHIEGIDVSISVFRQRQIHCVSDVEGYDSGCSKRIRESIHR